MECKACFADSERDRIKRIKRCATFVNSQGERKKDPYHYRHRSPLSLSFRKPNQQIGELILSKNMNLKCYVVVSNSAQLHGATGIKTAHLAHLAEGGLFFWLFRNSFLTRTKVRVFYGHKGHKCHFENKFLKSRSFRPLCDQAGKPKKSNKLASLLNCSRLLNKTPSFFNSVCASSVKPPLHTYQLTTLA